MGLGDGAGAIGIVRTEDKDAFSAEDEGVEIGYAQAFFGVDAKGVSSGPGDIVQGNGGHIGDGCGDTGFFQDVVGGERVAADDAADAVLGGLGDGYGHQLDILGFQKVKDFDEGALGVFYENGELVYSHGVGLF